MPPVLPAPEAVAELDAAPPEAAPAEQVAERALPFDVEHLGALRRAVLDHLVDTVDAGPQSVAMILASMPPGTTRGSAESAIKREFDAGRIERVGAGLYVLAKPKPVEPPKHAPPEPVRSEHTDEQWFAWLDDWKATDQWKGPGNPPDQSGHIVPADVMLKFNDRQRKREARRKEADEAAARRTAADRELCDRLIATTGGNIVRGPGIDDVSPIRAALELVPLDRILTSIRDGLHRLMCPASEPARSWRETRLLTRIAEDYCRTAIMPSLVDAWSKAGKAPATKTQSSPPDGDMPDDIDHLRGQSTRHRGRIACPSKMPMLGGR